jgi:hypothetical protein
MPRTTKTEQAKKRRVVAAGTLAGAPAAKIAKVAACSERHVRRIAKEPETRFLIAQALEPFHDKLRGLAKKAVAAVERGMTAQKKTKADYFTQLRAVERFGDLVEMAAGDSDSSDSRHSGKGRNLITWEEFLDIAKNRKGTTE